MSQKRSREDLNNMADASHSNDQHHTGDVNQQPPPPEGWQRQPLPPSFPQSFGQSQKYRDNGNRGGRTGGGGGNFNRGGSRGNFGGGGRYNNNNRGGNFNRGRGPRPPRQSADSAPIEAYYSRAMVDNPWRELEAQIVGQQQQQRRHIDTAGGRLDYEGAADRPWH